MHLTFYISLLKIVLLSIQYSQEIRLTIICGGLVGHLQSMILRLMSYCPMVLLSYVLWS